LLPAFLLPAFLLPAFLLPAFLLPAFLLPLLSCRFAIKPSYWSTLLPQKNPANGGVFCSVSQEDIPLRAPH
jgi:hypothetical protein